MPATGESVELNLVLAESALELVPKEIQRSPAVLSDSRRRGVDPSRILLDRSFHHSAMLKLRDAEKRGRPDLVHTALLSATGTPLFMEGLMKVYVHTNQDIVLEIGEGTRIPKSYFRFRGLAEKLLAQESDSNLIKVFPADLASLVTKRIAPGITVGLSTLGKPMGVKETADLIGKSRNPCLLVGGFPHGHFAPATLRLVDELFRIDSRPFEAHVVVARAVYEVENTVARLND